MQGVTSEVARRWRHRSEDAEAEQAKVMAERDEAVQLYPVSVDFDPPFDLLTHRAGRGERQSGADVGAAITTHGGWQPSVQPSRRPSLTDAVVGSMGGADSRRNVLIGELPVPWAGQAAWVACGYCVSAKPGCWRTQGAVVCGLPGQQPAHLAGPSAAVAAPPRRCGRGLRLALAGGGGARPQGARL